MCFVFTLSLDWTLDVSTHLPSGCRLAVQITDSKSTYMTLAKPKKKEENKYGADLRTCKTYNISWVRKHLPDEAAKIPFLPAFPLKMLHIQSQKSFMASSMRIHVQDCSQA
jgi:hypothetical protein